MESNNNNDFGKIIRNVGLFIGIPLVFFLILWLFLDPRTSSSNVKYSDYVAYFENNQVESYTLDLGNGNLELTLRKPSGPRTSTRTVKSTSAIMS